MKIRTALLLALLTTAYAATAQKLSLENVYKVNLRNMNAIISNNEVKGYFLFYQSDKIDRNTYEYTLQILDENLTKIKDVRFTDSKDVFLLEASFNENSLLFEFYDTKEKTIHYRAYDFTGTETNSYQRDLDQKSATYFAQAINSSNKEETENATLFPVGNRGFISLISIRDDGDYTFEVNYYGTDKKQQWSFVPESEYKVDLPQYLGCSDSVAIFLVGKRKSMLSAKVFVELLGINLFTGKQVFEYETGEKEKYNFLPMNVATVEGKPGFALTGLYFNQGDNFVKDKSLGIGIWVMNNKGEIVSSKYDSWETELAKFLPVNSKGKIDDVGYLYVHKIVSTADNKIFAIAEGYKQQASAFGITSTILSGGRGTSVVKLKITDFALLEYDKDFNLKNATIYDKGDNNPEMPSGTDFMGPQSMAAFAKMLGYFDYNFTQISNDHSSFVVGYKDYVKEDGYKGGTFNTITYAGGQITTDKINLKTEAKSLIVLPGKTGSVVILEYYRKQKKIDLHVEKMN